MDRLSINLLPPELKLSKKKEQKQSLLVWGSVSILILMIMLTAGLIFVSIYQKGQFDKETQDLDQLKLQIANYKDQEAIAYLLKNRLAGISQVEKKKFPQTQAFKLITSLTPSDVSLSSFRAAKADKVEVQGLTTTTQALGQYFTNLTDETINDGKIPKVTIDSLNRSMNGTMRFEMKVQVSGLDK